MGFVTKTIIRSCLALLVAGSAAAASGAPAPTIDFLAAQPGFAELGALAEPLDGPSLERAAFLASGIRPEELGPYQARLDRIIGGVAATATAGGAAPSSPAVAVAVLGLLPK
jgi:hypothetical protein